MIRHQKMQNKRKRHKGMRRSLTLSIVLLISIIGPGCATTVEYNNAKELMSHPEFPKAAFHAPDFTRAALKRLASLEYELERK